MPQFLPQSGLPVKMWGPDGELHDTKFIIPDSSYAPLYAATFENCIANGALDPATMGLCRMLG
jgi:Monomeric isocitrate dehydrogenase